MDDLSLEELQAALQTVQERKSTTRLSERNVVELVNKLRERGLLGTDLLHSINGKEYLTWEHLGKEIELAVRQAGGRIPVVDLPAQLGVDLTHCERQARHAVERSKGTMQIVQGEIITEAYFDGLAAEVEELLQESGVVALSDLARRFKLSSEMTLNAIAARLDAIIHGRLESGILYTAAYIARIKAQLRGALRGAALPVNLAALTKELDVQHTSSTAKHVSSLVEELLTESAIFGVLKAGTFTPSIFAKAQHQAAHSFYTQNSFIGYDMLERLGVSNPAAYMAAAFPEGVPLETAFVAPQLAAQLEAAVEEAVSSGTWLDAQAVLPSALGTADAALMLERSATLQGKGSSGASVIASTCVSTAALLDDLQQRSLALAREVAEAALQKRRASAASASASAPTAAAPGHAKGITKKQAAPDGESDDDWDTGKSGSKKKKGAKKKGPAKGKTGPATTAPGKGKQGGDADSDAATELSLEALTGKVEAWLPEAVGAGESGTFTEALAAQLRPTVLAEYERALAAVFLAGAEDRRRKKDGIAKALHESHQQLQLYAHGAELASSDEASYTALQRHLLRAIGQRVLDLILRYQEVDLRDEQQDDAAANSQQSLQPLAAAERANLLKLLPPDTGPSAAAAAEKTLNGSHLTAALEALEGAAAAAGLQLRKLDKKAEKALVQDHRRALEQKLASQNDSAEALSLAVPLLVAQVHGRAMSIPGKALSGVLSLLKGELPADAYQQLSEFHSLVVDNLRTQQAEHKPRLLALLQVVKGIAGLGEPRGTGIEM